MTVPVCIARHSFIAKIKFFSYVRCIFIILLTWTQLSHASEADCLTKNLYWESRNQTANAMYAVAEVVMSRVADQRWPDTVCGVIKQKRRGICQFSWYCDGVSDEPLLHIPREREAWQLAEIVAKVVIEYGPSDLTKGALWYHSNKVRPKWSYAYLPIRVIEDHIFYTEH